MTQDHTNLETFLKKAVNPNNDELDIPSIDGAVNIIKSKPELSFDFTKMLVPHLRSSNVRESLLTLDALEELMDANLVDFKVEVSKFRFLNELIKLVSLKHEGHKTQKEIKDRILDILFTWTDKYPDLTKIKDCYQMLKTQGIVHQPIQNVIKNPSNQKKQEEHKDSTLKLMESEKFKKLLQSRDPMDVQSANLMIQNMVRENDRKLQNQNRRLMEVQRAYESSTLLNDMLTQYSVNELSEDTISTLKEIYENCEKMKPTISRMADETSNEQLLNEVLKASDSLNSALDKYQSLVVRKEDLPASEPKVARNLLDVESSRSDKSSHANNMDELEEIFANPSKPSKPLDFDIADILAPQMMEEINSQIIPIDIKSLIQKSPVKTAPQTSDFDLLSDFELGNSSMKGKPIVIQKPIVQPAKTSKLAEIDSIVTGMKTSLLAGSSKSEPENKTPDTSKEDDQMLGDLEDDLMIESPLSKEPPAVELPEPIKKSLAELEIDVNNMEPSNEPPRVLVDEIKGLKILMNFAKDRPREDVLVIVLTVINQGSQIVKNFQFDASVSKPCKIRLLKPSSTDLPAVKKFKPPTEQIEQVLLLSNPTEQEVNIICILSYCLDDDPDPIKEHIEVKNIPFAYL